MKLLFVIAIMLSPFMSLAQKSKGKGFLKIIPTAFFVKDQNLAPGIIGSFGARGKYFAAGLSTGYYKLQSLSKGIMPIGAEITFTEYAVKRISPVISFGAYYPVTNNVDKTGSGSLYTNTETKGKFESHISGGIAFPIKTKKIVFMGGYSSIKLGTTIKSRNGSTFSNSSSSYSLNMVTLSVGLIL